jgi:hypothetical protein
MRRSKSIAPDERFRLLHGPYRPPRTKPGQILCCRLRGKMTVVRFSDGRIPWPLARNDLNGGRGHGTYVLCGDLIKALRLESNQAIQYWWGG